MDLEIHKKDYLKELQLIENKGAKIFLCPFLGRSKQTLLCYYFVYFLVLFTSLQLFFTLCLNGFSDWMEIINIAPNIGACLMSTIKYTIIHKNRKLYDMIFCHLRDDMWDVTERTEINVEVFIEYKKIWKLINKFVGYSSIVLIIVVDSLPWFLMMYENRVLDKDLQYLYPFDAWYPFDKVKWYSVAYIWESFMTAVVICIYAFANIIHLSYIALICMELTLLGNCLERLIGPQDIKHITQLRKLHKTHTSIKRNLKSIIKKYGFLDEITKGLDKCLGEVMLLSYLFGAVFICLTAFSFTVVDDLYKSVRYFSFFLSLLVEMFNQCIIGQVLINHSVEISAKIYSSNWIYADSETKKILLLLIMRTQTTFTLTANRYLTMDLNTFSRICSSSYQFFNLLRTVYHP